MSVSSEAPTQASLEHIDSLSSRLQLLYIATLQQQQLILLARREGKLTASCSEGDNVSAVAVKKWSFRMLLTDDKSDYQVRSRLFALPERCRTTEDTVADAKHDAEA